MQIAFYTLGCKVNQYDTQMMREKLEAEGHQTVPFHQIADCYIINTCTVTNMSDKKSRQIISRCKKINPDAIIVVCGCYSQISPREAASIDGVDLILGTANRKEISSYLNAFLSNKDQIVAPADLDTETVLSNEHISRFDEKTRAILKIEDGCRNFCSYCAIPFARGKIRSKKPEEINAELAALLANGYREIVLTGIHLASYGKDLENLTLADAILQTAQFGFDRIRLGSLEPKIITEDFLNRIKTVTTLMPSFHLSLQSGCDTVLKRMNRHYTTEEYMNAVKLLRKHYPDCSVTTDIIVGFPGETDAEFEETLRFAQKVSFAKIHIFPFSPRRGTKAAEMPQQIAGDIKTKRCKELEAVEAKCRSDFMNQHIGKSVKVLIEQEKEGMWEGYSENYLPVRLSGDSCPVGKVITITVEDTDGDSLLSKL